MIERFIHTAIADGLALIKQKPQLLEDIFEDLLELPATEVAAIKLLFEKKPPTVHHGYPRRDYDFPLYSIILGSEQESMRFIGNDGGMVDDVLDDDFGADIQTAIWTHNYQIYCYAEHPDVTRYLYETAKSILLGAQPYFQERRLMDIDYSGMDLMPDPRYIPEHLFVRQLNMRCQREFCRLDRNAKLQKAFKGVIGAHIDNSGSPSDVGGVKTNVKTYQTGEE